MECYLVDKSILLTHNIADYINLNHLGFGFGLTYIVPLSIAMKVIILQIFYIHLN